MLGVTIQKLRKWFKFELHKGLAIIDFFFQTFFLKLLDRIPTLFLWDPVHQTSKPMLPRGKTICKLEQSLITFLFAYQIYMFSCHLHAALLQSIIKSLAKFASECYNSVFVLFKVRSDSKSESFAVLDTWMPSRTCLTLRIKAFGTMFL